MDNKCYILTYQGGIHHTGRRLMRYIVNVCAQESLGTGWAGEQQIQDITETILWYPLSEVE